MTRARAGWVALAVLGAFALGDGFAQAAYPPPVPQNLILVVRETAGVARSGELARSGVPVPRSLNLRNPNALTLVDASGTPVPAEFEALARWDAGRTVDAPIQWLLVTFAATVPAGGTASYRVVTDGSAGPNPPPSVPLVLTQAGNQVTVNTGAATFRLGGSASALFDEVRLPNNAVLVNGSTLSARANSTDTTHTATARRIVIEHSGPLAAIVRIEGTYDLAPVGGGGLGSFRRYVFTAGSPTAIVRHAVAWEGDRCGLGALECGGAPNGVRVQRVRDTMTLNLGSSPTVTAVGDLQAAAVSGTVSLGQDAWVRQQLRAHPTDPLGFDVNVAGATAAGSQADGGILSVSGTGGAVAVALNHMHRYEPQALRVLADGRLAIDVADDQAWLAGRQGLFATVAVSALPAGPARADLDRLVWAPLNRPLRAWPEPAWFAASQAVDEFPVGPLTPAYASYDTLVPSVLNTTLQKIDEVGLPGLMTFGLYPRIWGNPIYADEVTCGGNDVTPGEPWDETFWCTTWTDYHNTAATAPIWAMRTGDVSWLDELAFPAALRMLHTQILQCAPGDTFFYCGQAPAGYGGYRADNNSSHQYWDNLILYYWLTGDYTVVETLKRGSQSMRNYLCVRRPAAPCLPDDPPTDIWAGLVDRVASQWTAAFRFVGLASDDAGYLDDYKSNLARAVTQWYVEPEQSGTRYGFLLFSTDPVDGPGTDTSNQLWMASLYDMNVLFRLQRDTSDAPIGNPLLAPTGLQAAWARTLVTFGSTVAPGGNGTAGGPWPNTMDFTWSGNRIGGTLSGVAATPGGGDPLLYDTGKATLTAVLVRAGEQTGSASLTQMGADLTTLALGASQADGSPLGKFQGEYLSRLHAAVARLSAPPAGCPSITVGPVSLPVGRVGAAYSQTFTQTGGATPASFSLSGALAAGLSFNAATATLSGTPSQSGQFTLVLTVSDAGNCRRNRGYSLLVTSAAGTGPTALAIDAAGNSVFEPGETAVADPTWFNNSGSSVALTGSASIFTGPAGPTYTITDGSASYGTVASGGSASCSAATGDCYALSVASTPRPATHWDATVVETSSTGDAKTWTLHIGNSFSDTVASHPFYRFIETALHAGVTSGCTSTQYCPGGSTTRAQMAAFLLRARFGGGYTPPAAVGIFADVPAADPFAPWAEDLYNRGITSGCSTNPLQYCPTTAVSRAQMAVFLLRTLEGSAFTPPPPTGMFQDVPATNPFAGWIEDLAGRGITSGCSTNPPLYCPGSGITRGQMAVFLVRTFGLRLYGP